MPAKHQQKELFSDKSVVACKRCGLTCRVDPIPQSNARLLKRSKDAGLCVNCAVHDALRNLYPANLLLARSGPNVLALPHIQRQFFAIAQSAGTDATFEEIDWSRIILNWELPFTTKLTRSPMNPVGQADLDSGREAGQKARREGWKPPLTPREERAKHKAEIDHGMRAVVDCIHREYDDEDS